MSSMTLSTHQCRHFCIIGTQTVYVRVDESNDCYYNIMERPRRKVISKSFQTKKLVSSILLKKSMKIGGTILTLL